MPPETGGGGARAEGGAGAFRPLLPGGGGGVLRGNVVAGWLFLGGRLFDTEGLLEQRQKQDLLGHDVIAK